MTTRPGAAIPRCGAGDDPLPPAVVPVAAGAAGRAAGGLALAARAPAAGHAAVPAPPRAAGARTLRAGGWTHVLAVPDSRGRLPRRGAGAAAGPRQPRAPGGHRLHRPAGRIDVDARDGRAARPLAALDGLAAHVRRDAELDGSAGRPGAVRLPPGAAGAPDDRSERLLLLPRPPGRRAAVPPRGRHQLGHEHRGGDLLGRQDGRRRRGAVRAPAERPGVRRRLRRTGLERRGGQGAGAGPQPRHPRLRRRGRHDGRRPHTRSAAAALRAAARADPFGAGPAIAAGHRAGRRRALLRAGHAVGPVDRVARSGRRPAVRPAHGPGRDRRGAVLAPAGGRGRVDRPRGAVHQGAHATVVAARRRDSDCSRRSGRLSEGILSAGQTESTSRSLERPRRSSRYHRFEPGSTPAGALHRVGLAGRRNHDATAAFVPDSGCDSVFVDAQRIWPF